MISFDKIVNKLLKKGGKIIFRNDINEIIDPERKPCYDSLVTKTIYKLRAEGIILPLKAGVYIIPDKEDSLLNKVDLIDKYYLRLVKKYITFHVGGDYFISGKKALEFHMKNYEVPNKLTIITRDTNKKILVGDHEIIFKTISGKVMGKKTNLYSRLSEFSINKLVDSNNFKISNLELSLLESALVYDNENGVDIQLLTRAIKKYAKIMNMENFHKIGKLKFIMSFNRIKELSKNIYPELSQVCLDVIKRNGGLFIGEGLRGF